ncbi:class I SAM-dependent methyltransferase [Streptomyces sp. SID13031]|uniref:methyltransferase domain-containing protein n=1 Tax=Streptomyces sp. SID13031 TaxID=2706046 RepID=UPI0013CAB4A3|nr:class I SAM-dependent methyltransferase [Streptomyces sp. SID13031]
MTARLPPRLAEIVAALPISPQDRILEIGCGPGVAARAIARRLDTGHILAVDRSAAAIEQLRALSAPELGSGRLSARQTSIEDFTLDSGEDPFDLVFAVRVGALDGRHPAEGKIALERIAAITSPDARLFIDGGSPPREPPIRC